MLFETFISSIYIILIGLSEHSLKIAVQQIGIPEIFWRNYEIFFYFSNGFVNLW